MRSSLSPDRLYIALSVDRYISACFSIFETEGCLILRVKAISAWALPSRTAQLAEALDLPP